MAETSQVTESDTLIHYWSLTKTAGAIRTNELSPVDLTRILLNRINALDGDLKSYATVRPGRAMASTRAAQSEIAEGNCLGPLHGVPIAIKDLCYTCVVRTTGGMAVYADFVPGFDATVVATWKWPERSCSASSISWKARGTRTILILGYRRTRGIGADGRGSRRADRASKRRPVSAMPRWAPIQEGPFEAPVRPMDSLASSRSPVA